MLTPFAKTIVRDHPLRFCLALRDRDHMGSADKTEKLIRELHDRALIQDLLIRYGRAVDGRDLDAVAACFLADAEYEGFLGKGPVRDMLDALRKVLPRYEKTMHLLSPRVIQVHESTARSETHGIVYHRLIGSEGPKDRIVGVCYVDELACNNQGWRITKRTARIDWQREDPTPVPLAG